MTASLRDYLFTDCEKETRDKVNATQNKEILPPKRWKYHYFISYLMLFEYDLQKIERQETIKRLPLHRKVSQKITTFCIK